MVAVVDALINPAVEQECDGEAQQQAQRGHPEGRGGLHRLGDHVQGDDAEHQAGGEAEEQAGGPGGLVPQEDGQTAAQAQAPHAGEGGEQDDKEQGSIHVDLQCIGRIFLFYLKERDLSNRAATGCTTNA